MITVKCHSCAMLWQQDSPVPSAQEVLDHGGQPTYACPRCGTLAPLTAVIKGDPEP